MADVLRTDAASAPASATDTSDVPGGNPSFAAALATYGLPALRRTPVTTLQVNVGKVCNQACHHCHVDAGPTRTERMERATIDRLLAVLDASPSVTVVDVTGGAPELNPEFRSLVRAVRARDRRVQVRCNLTVLFQPGMEELPEFYRANAVELVCSLPCYTAENVDRQRGLGVFERSIRALQRLNGIGYGMPGSGLSLDLVYNPVGPSLPPAQRALEARYKDELRRAFGIEFGRLFTITNMPIKRFAEMLIRTAALPAYMGLLVNHFNPATVEGLMCRSLLSVGWDGALYDCDFNQMLELPLAASERATLWTIASFDELAGAAIATGGHCYGCTAGAGSSCGGSLDTP